MTFILLQLLAIALFACALYFEATGTRGAPQVFVVAAVISLASGWAV